MNTVFTVSAHSTFIYARMSAVNKYIPAVQAASNRPVDELNLVEMAPLVEVDNDNDPVPENLPTAPNTGTFDIEEE